MTANCVGDRRSIERTQGGNGMRIAVLLEERCKPNSSAYMYLEKYAGMCGGECIQLEDGKFRILEMACPVCFTRAKLCPGESFKIINSSF